MSILKIEDLHLIKGGKVSGLYRTEKTTRSGSALKVMGDGISAFDVVVGQIPGKGVENNKLSNFWKAKFAGVIDNDIISTDDARIADHLGFHGVSKELKGRISMIELGEVIPIEAIVRGCFAGSFYERYKKHNGVGCCIDGHWFPAGMKESQRLLLPIFTPTTKAPAGHHDEPINYESMTQLISDWLAHRHEISGFSGSLLAQAIRSTSIALYSTAYNIALKKGIIIADAKFEYAMIYSCNEGCVWKLVLIDEVLTPDSSRFWPLKGYEPGRSQPSLDKQFFRDWLTKEANWDKVSSPPEIPANVKKETLRRYQKISKILTS